MRTAVPPPPLPCVTLRRARPLLGTFVEIRVTATDAAQAEAALTAGFTAVQRIHACMSPREPQSDLCKLRRAPLRRAFSVDPWTWQVLAAGRAFSELSEGAFDVTVVRGGPTEGDWRDLDLLPCHQVRILHRVTADLGGIAKGFAVDQAVQALRAANAIAGCVNAGGDLAVFGPTAEAVFVRHPSRPGCVVPAAKLSNEAFATSSNAADPRGQGRLLRPDGGRLWIGRGSVSVRAPSCLAADALCKAVAAIGPARCAALLERHHAVAYVLRLDAGRREVRRAA